MEENKKNSNVLIIILVVLLFISVGVICYLLGTNSVKDNNENNGGNNTTQNEEKENNKDANDEQVEEDDSITPVSYEPKCVRYDQNNVIVDIDVTKYNNIADYIKKQQNVQMSISYCQTVSSEGIYNLTDTEKNKVLDDIKNRTFEISSGGLGGACVPNLTITYERNNKEYEVGYYSFFALSSNDGNIYKIIDKSVDNTLSDPQNCAYVVYDYENPISSVEQIWDNIRANR